MYYDPRLPHIAPKKTIVDNTATTEEVVAYIDECMQEVLDRGAPIEKDPSVWDEVDPFGYIENSDGEFDFDYEDRDDDDDEY